MARLDLYRAGRWRKTLVLADRSYIVGRDPDCDLVLEDKHASRRHFRLVFRTAGEYGLEDIDTPNGTVVNGAREYGRVLMGQCVLQVGTETMLFDPEAGQDSAPATQELPGWALVAAKEQPQPADGSGPPSTVYMAMDKLNQVQGQERARLRPHLVSSVRRGKKIIALDASTTPIGFGHVAASIGAAADGKDKVLAEVLGDAEAGYRVKAKGLFAKVAVNGEKKREHALKDGDTIDFGLVQFTFRPGLRGKAPD